MLQRVLASLLCLLGAAAIGSGIASATLWRASDTLVASASAGPGATLLITDPGVLEMAADEVSVTVTASRGEQVVLVVGRTADVEAWVGTDAVTRVTGLSDLDRLSTKDVAESAPAPAETEAPAEGEAAPEAEAEAPAEGEAAPEAEAAAAAAAPDPAGSDLWVAEAVGSDEATLTWSEQDGRWTVLAASTGEGAGPPTVTMTWPQVVTTPWLVPGVAGGAVLLLAGLLWWTLLLLRGRRARFAMPAGRVGPPASAQESPQPGAPVGGTTGGTTDGATDPSGVPAAPLTRRQIRELEQQRSARPRSSRADTTGAWHQVIPGPAPATDPTAVPTTGSTADPTTGPSADRAAERTASGSPAERPVDRGSMTTRWGERIAEHIPHLGRRVRSTSEDESSRPVASTVGPADADAVTAHPTSGPSGSQGAASSQATGHSGVHPHPAAPAPSADAWRRAWGFPAESPPVVQGSAGPSDAPEPDAARADEHGRTGTEPDGTEEGR